MSGPVAVDTNRRTTRASAEARLQERIGVIPRHVRDRFALLQGTADQPSATVRELPTRRLSLARRVATAIRGGYEDLVARGDRLVERIRRQPATRELPEQAEATAPRAKTTRTTATKAAGRTRRAARGTAEAAAKIPG